MGLEYKSDKVKKVKVDYTFRCRLCGNSLKYVKTWRHKGYKICETCHKKGEVCE